MVVRCILAMAAFVTMSGHDVSAGLIAHWSGEGSAIDTANGQDGVLVGNTIFAAGKVGQAFSFDGANDYIRIPTAPTLEPGAFSVSAWIKLANTGSSKVLIADSMHGAGQAGGALQTQGNRAIGQFLRSERVARFAMPREVQICTTMRSIMLPEHSMVRR